MTIAWTGLLAPAHTPQPIVAKLNATINDGLKTPALQSALTTLSYAPMGGTPQDFTATMTAAWRAGRRSSNHSGSIIWRGDGAVTIYSDDRDIRTLEERAAR